MLLFENNAERALKLVYGYIVKVAFLLALSVPFSIHVYGKKFQRQSITFYALVTNTHCLAKSNVWYSFIQIILTISMMTHVTMNDVLSFNFVWYFINFYTILRRC